MEQKKKFRLKGHESFHIREGWLGKGLRHIVLDNKIFTREDSMDKIGVGSNMVKAIRYWLQTTGLAHETIEGGKRIQSLTKGFGDIIFSNDPYFEDLFSLWLIHYKISTNKELSTSWYLFFNRFNATEFRKEDLISGLNLSLNNLLKSDNYSKKSLEDDCNCILKTYYYDKKEDINPEESTICPLTALGLINKLELSNGSQYYVKSKPSSYNLDKLIVLYIILDNLGETDLKSSEHKGVPIESILNDECNAGKVLNLDRNTLNEYIDLLRNEEYIHVNRTAGLDRIYINEMDKTKILLNYYAQTKE